MKKSQGILLWVGTRKSECVGAINYSALNVDDWGGMCQELRFRHGNFQMLIKDLSIYEIGSWVYESETET